MQQLYAVTLYLSASCLLPHAVLDSSSALQPGWQPAPPTACWLVPQLHIRLALWARHRQAPPSSLQPQGDGRHVEIMVVSKEFEGKSAVNRQRMVYKVRRGAAAMPAALHVV